MKSTACVWCSALIKVEDDYDDLRFKGVCSTGCKDAETLFNLHYSDENIKNRAVWERIANESGEDKQ